MYEDVHVHVTLCNLHAYTQVFLQSLNWSNGEWLPNVQVNTVVLQEHHKQ